MHTLEVYHWLTCRPKLCVLWILSVEWKDSLHLCVSAFFYKGFSLNGYVSLKFFLIKMNIQQLQILYCPFQHYAGSQHFEILHIYTDREEQ